jgi:DNA repair photolyase
MAGKPVGFLPCKSVLTSSVKFSHKLLTDGPILNMGDTCVFSCQYCYVPGMAKVIRPALQVVLKAGGVNHEDVVIKRCGETPAVSGLELLQENLKKLSKPKKEKKLVGFASTSVDPAANMDDVDQTAAALILIFKATNWDFRILSKSNLLPEIAKLVTKESKKFKDRMIFGVSTGTLDDKLASAIEIDAPLVSKRLKSLHWLQEHGYRTFGMICPSLPQDDYDKFSSDVCKAINVDACEHVWAEPMNIRGNSINKTITALISAGFTKEAAALSAVSGSGKKPVWELYAQATFEAHTKNIPAAKLRFLHYPPASNRTKAWHVATRAWWLSRTSKGAICLSK